jgi:hypothetical protein
MTRDDTTCVRRVLRNNADGLTEKEITGLTRVDADSLNRMLQTMPDTYIDRWTGPTKGQYSAVWCVVVPPQDCPRPTKVES